MSRSDKMFEVMMVGVVALLVLPALRAFVLSELWGWFVVPLGVQDIGVWHAYGFALVAGLLTSHSSSDDDDSGPWATLVGYVLGALVVYGLGALAATMMV